MWWLPWLQSKLSQLLSSGSGDNLFLGMLQLAQALTL